MTLGALLLGATALLLHLALSVAAAPLSDALAGWAAARLAAGAIGAGPWRLPSRADLAASVRRPWRRLAWLMAKEPVLADNASAVGSLATVVALAVTLAAASLVPSFCLGLPTGAVADLPTVLALLGLARLALLLGSLETGSAAPGLAATVLSAAALLALPGMLLAVATLWLLCGGTGLEAILSALRDGAAASGRGAPELLATLALALAAVAASDGADDPSQGPSQGLAQELSGPDLGLFALQSGLQRLVWIELVTALAWPGSLAAAQANPLHWPLGLLLWALRVAAGCVLLSAARGMLGRPGGRPGSRGELAAASVLLGLLAPLLLLAGRAVE